MSDHHSQNFKLEIEICDDANFVVIGDIRGLANLALWWFSGFDVTAIHIKTYARNIATQEF